MSESPFVLSTSDLGRRPGSMRELELQVSSEHRLGSDVIAVPAGDPIELDLRLESVMEGVLVTGVARARAHGECVRCLQEVSTDLRVDLTELFAYPDGRHPRAEEEDEEAEPLPELVGDTLDLEPTVIDIVVTALPFRPLCRPDCAGLCSECGVRLDDAEPGHGHERIDPRWAALAALAGAPDAEAPEEATSDEEDPEQR